MSNYYVLTKSADYLTKEFTEYLFAIIAIYSSYNLVSYRIDSISFSSIDEGVRYN